MSLNDEIRDLANAEGAEFFGVSNLAPARAAIVDQGGSDLGQFTHAISLGIGLLHSIVDQLSVHPDAQVAELYKYYCYDLINDCLNKIGNRVASLLQGKSYHALSVPAAYTADAKRLCGIFSSKMAAHLAGLGWIGKSCLLVTPEVGPRVRWATVLTNAPLTETGKAMEQRCGDCRACVEVCPAQAFTGRSFDEKEAREARFRAEDCNSHLQKMKELLGLSVCGLCLKVCPHGVKASRN